MTRALAYVRCSTEQQHDSTLGLEAQRATIEAESIRRGWGPACIITEVASGKSLTNRPELVRAIVALDNGEADVLIVARLDRLARSVADFAGLLDRAERNGWAIVALDADVDTTSASGRLMVSILAAFAEYERRIISQRTKEALAAKRAEGHRFGRPLELDPTTRALIAELRSAGMSLHKIAAELEDRVIPTARGGRWHPSTVRAVLGSHELDRAAAKIRAARGRHSAPVAS